MSVLYCTLCDTDINQCGSSDEYSSLQCCPNCGAVVDEEQVFTHDRSSKDFSGSLVNANGSQVYGNGFNASQRSRLPTSLCTATERGIKDLVNQVCSCLKLSLETIEQINCFIFGKVYTEEHFKYSKDKIILVGSCVYVMCKSNNLPIALRQVAVACNRSRFTIGAFVKLLVRRFELNQTPVTTKDLLPVACSHLENAKQCEDLALQLYSQTSNAMASNCLPSVQAAAHAAIASLAVNKSLKEKDLFKYLMEKMFLGTRSTFLNCIKSLKQHMKKMLTEIPWVDMKYVTMKNIHFYIKDITRYRKSIGAFAGESEDPSWFHEKQKIFSGRHEKILKAKERIRLRKVCDVRDEGETAEEERSEENIELNKEDEIIEELLEMGCSMEDIQEGYYECLKTTLSTSCDILEEEIESYVRTPEEIKTLEQLTDEDEPVPKLRKKSMPLK